MDHGYSTCPGGGSRPCVALATSCVRTDKLELRLVSEKVPQDARGVNPVVLSEAASGASQNENSAGPGTSRGVPGRSCRWTAIVRDQGFNLSDPFAARLDGLLAGLAVALVRVASTTNKACSSVESAVYRTRAIRQSCSMISVTSPLRLLRTALTARSQ